MGFHDTLDAPDPVLDEFPDHLRIRGQHVALHPDFDDDVEGIRALKGKHICINIRTSNFCGQKRDGGILPDLDMALANRLS